MLDLLLNTSIFLQLDGPHGDQYDVAKANYYQLAGPSLSDFLNNPVAQPVLPPLHTSSTRPAGAGAPLKRCLSEIDGADAKNVDKKIRPNRLRPAAAEGLELTNTTNITKRRGTTTPAITNDSKSGVKCLHSGKQEPHVTKTCNSTCTCNNKPNASKNATVVQRDLRTLGEIIFVRSRMFYSKPAYNGRGEVEFGLRHIRVFFSFFSFFSFSPHPLFCFSRLAARYHVHFVTPSTT
ncbi:hypothetical protein DFP73DRAFT_340943 [Morchella snyderi]|nr:hypothetical protein DFP73DRAFT_340943 [Morchella snyderi]